MLIENTFFGTIDKVQTSIDRIRLFEPENGYRVAFSGGKDSIVLYELVKRSEVKFQAHFNLTTIDPPEQIAFVKENYPEVTIKRPARNMWRLIIENGMPPTRRARYCCQELKEHDPDDSIILTGVRWAESYRRKRDRKFIEKSLFARNTFLIHPILDWEDEDIWEFIHTNGMKYCSLYNEGIKRIGCVGCPITRRRTREKEFERWPTYYKMYLKTFDKMLEYWEKKGKPRTWKNAEEVMRWWLDGSEPSYDPETSPDAWLFDD